jgi:hypothetical protein
MFNAKAQSTLKFLNDWKTQGVGFYRFECLHETADELLEKLETYIKFLNQELTLSEAYKILGSKETYGLQSGPIDRVKEYQSRKK